MTGAPMATKTVKFTDLTEIDFQDGQGKLVYKVDSVHTLRADKADRWIRRGRAVEVTTAEMAELMSAAMPAQAEKPKPVAAAELDPAPARPQVLSQAAPASAVAATVPAGASAPVSTKPATEVPSDGNTVAGSSDVGGANGGSAGVGSVNVGGRGRGRQGS